MVTTLGSKISGPWRCGRTLAAALLTACLLSAVPCLAFAQQRRVDQRPDRARQQTASSPGSHTSASSSEEGELDRANTSARLTDPRLAERWERMRPPLSTGQRLPGWRRGLAPVLSVVPGLLLHGAGHAGLGQWSTAGSLLAAQWGGAAMLVGGIAGLAASGAYDALNPPLIWTMMAGGLGFFGTWFADLYGATGASQLGLRAPKPARFRASLGYQLVQNPVLAPQNFLSGSLRGRLGRWSLGGQGWFDLGGADRRVNVRLGYRLLGPTPSEEGRGAVDPHLLELQLGYLRHRYGQRQPILENTGELLLRGRLGLEWLAPTMRGAFIQGSLGLGAGNYVYPEIDQQEGQSLLLGTIGFGMFLGDGRDSWGQVVAYYDHRHDGYAAGTKSAGLGSGAIGHFGLMVERSILRDWGLQAQIGAGAAWVVNAGLVYRFGLGR